MKKKQKPYKPEVLTINMWRTPHSPRWYAQKILELRPDLRQAAIERVPEGVRDWVKGYVTDEVEKRRCALKKLKSEEKKERNNE